MARALHYNSQRRDGPFVEVNCASIPEKLMEAEVFGAERGAYTGAVASHVGYVETAEGGTLFLDEIGCLSMPLQAKLLTVLESRTYRRVGSRSSGTRTSRWWPRRTWICARRSSATHSARTCSTASRSSCCVCRRCAIAARIACGSPRTCATRSAATTAFRRDRSPTTSNELIEAIVAWQRARAPQRARADPAARGRHGDRGASLPSARRAKPSARPTAARTALSEHGGIDVDVPEEGHGAAGGGGRADRSHARDVRGQRVARRAHARRQPRPAALSTGQTWCVGFPNWGISRMRSCTSQRCRG